jgi:hypothetical protein
MRPGLRDDATKVHVNTGHDRHVAGRTLVRRAVHVRHVRWEQDERSRLDLLIFPAIDSHDTTAAGVEEHLLEGVGMWKRANSRLEVDDVDVELTGAEGLVRPSYVRQTGPASRGQFRRDPLLDGFGLNDSQSWCHGFSR